MIDAAIATLGAVALAGAALLAWALLLALPGFAIARLVVRDHGGPSAVLAATVAASAVVGALVSGTLIVLGLFDGAYVAAVGVVLSVASLPATVAWIRAGGRALRRSAAALAIALVPWILTLGRPGYPPAETLQWYYWNVGSALSAVGSIPLSVSEYGLPLRWLPDYVFFNGVSEGFRSILWFLEPAQVAVAWRVPVAAAGIVGLYLVARLWLSRPAAIVATGSTVVSIFFLNKFNAYKPESLAIVVALFAAWLIVDGVRRRRVPPMVLGGLALGTAMGMHAIAATVVGLLLGGASLAELIVGSERRRWMFAALAASAAVALAVVLATGLTLQGRPLVVTDALRPAISSDGDPTWLYLQYSYGNFDVGEPPPVREHLATGIRRPWAGVDITNAQGGWFFWLVGVGALLGWARGGSRVRRGLLAGLLGSAALVAGMLFFAVAFRTYVPQHTGLVRFGQYVPLLAGLGLGFAIEGMRLAWEAVAQRAVPGRLASLALLAVVVLAVPAVDSEYQRDTGLEPAGVDALRVLRLMGSPGDVVLSNAATTGTIEMFTGLEAPLEGRQPLIEEPTVLEQANRLLLGTRDLFGPEGDPSVALELGVRWLLVVDRPATLGAPGSFGGSVGSAAELPWATERWRGDRIAIYETNGMARSSPALRARSAAPVGWAVAVTIVGVLSAAAVVLLGTAPGSVAGWVPRGRERGRYTRV